MLHADVGRGVGAAPRPDGLVVTAADGAGEGPVALREPATHDLAVPPPSTDCGQAIPGACRQAVFTPTPTPRYATADIAAQPALARAGLATALVPRTAIDPSAPGIRAVAVADVPILRLLFAATRRTGTANPTTTAVVFALRTAAREVRAARPSAD